jgi:hypothetical protein
MRLWHALSCGTVQRSEKCVELGPDQRYAHHPILVIRFGVRGKRDRGERHHEGSDYSTEQKEKLRHALMAEAGSLMLLESFAFDCFVRNLSF